MIASPSQPAADAVACPSDHQLRLVRDAHEHVARCLADAQLRMERLEDQVRAMQAAAYRVAELEAENRALKERIETLETSIPTPAPADDPLLLQRANQEITRLEAEMRVLQDSHDRLTLLLREQDEFAGARAGATAPDDGSGVEDACVPAGEGSGQQGTTVETVLVEHEDQPVPTEPAGSPVSAAVEQEPPVSMLLAALETLGMASRAHDAAQALMMGRVSDLAEAVQELRRGQKQIVGLIGRSTGATVEPEEAGVAVAVSEEPTGSDVCAAMQESSPPAAATPIVSGPVAAGAESEISTGGWEQRYGTIEDAWLAGEVVGDEHEHMHFCTIARMLAPLHPKYADGAALLADLRAVRARVGDAFAYCLLEAALKEMHKPSLLPALVTVKMAQLHRRHDQCRR